MKNKKKIIIISAISLVLLIAAYFVFKKAPESELIVKPKKGYFKVTVTTTGELRAKNAIDVRGPSGLERLNIYQVKISKLIAEGTKVKAGDFIAELDRSEIMTKIKENEIQIQKYESQFLQAKLDSNLNLSSARNDIENMKYSLEEKRLAKEQSIYEAPSVRRQAEIAYERELKAYDQAIKNYGTKVQQSIAKLSEVGADLSMEKQSISMIMQIFDQFTVKAPADGMLIYMRNWNGTRLTEGSTINTWNPIVARLPDLSIMESVTFVNEIDIQKIKVGQSVRLSLDANTNKKVWGSVVSVANIGEERKNSDSKVFEVVVRINGQDSTLLPSMTTSNEVVVEEFKDVIHVPIESLFSIEQKGKKINYLIKKNGNGFVKQEVEIGAMNDSEVIIKRGISTEDEILLALPSNHDQLTFNYLKKSK